MKMPILKRTPAEAAAIAKELHTSHLIRALWEAASPTERKSPAFLKLLMQCAWCNTTGGEYNPSTMLWRNNLISKYLGARSETSPDIAAAAAKRWTKVKQNAITGLLARPTGFSGYHKPIRPVALDFMKRHAEHLSKVVAIVADRGMRTQSKLGRAMDLLESLPRMDAPAGGETSIINALSPALACLDPHRHFPVMNRQTARLLSSIGVSHDAAGAKALSRLIGKYGIKNNLELDVYSMWYADQFPVHRRKRTVLLKKSTPIRVVGLKSEEDSLVRLNKGRVRMRREHNKLINAFREALLGRHTLHESHFDALIPNWKSNRSLLIEAKTAASGPGGRAQIRQAIGQLFDYRQTYFPKTSSNVDLAVLLPTKPPKDVLALLTSLSIDTLWLAGKDVAGTVAI